MIDRAKLEQYRFLVTKNPNAYISEISDEMKEVFDTIDKLLAVKEAAEKVLQTLNQGHFVDGPGQLLLKALEACSDPEGAK